MFNKHERGGMASARHDEGSELAEKIGGSERTFSGHVKPVESDTLRALNKAVLPGFSDLAGNRRDRGLL
jgi:hypothetical protein